MARDCDEVEVEVEVTDMQVEVEVGIEERSEEGELDGVEEEGG
jgi:hypothetical protein